MVLSDRRTILKQTGASLAAVSTLSLLQTRAAGANEKVVMGAIGCGGQGTNLLTSFASMQGVELAYVCDPDTTHATRAAKEVERISGKAPKVVKDLRQVLDDKSVDAVTVATPDHWHAPAAILACNAGKHVYVEKPCSHNIREGRLLVEAAQRNSRIVQHGTQSRSDGLVLQAIQLLRSGIIGDVLVAKAWNVQQRKEIGRASASEPPAGFDYDLWVGPAPLVPFQKNRHHYSWHWWYDFGTGDTGNDGVHELDIARWGLGVETHPSAVSAMGGKLYFDDDQQFPDTQMVMFDYPGDGQVGERRQLCFEMRLWSRYGLEEVDNGNAFYGTKGWMLLSKRGILKVFGADKKPIPISQEQAESVGHRPNFVDSIRSNTQPNAPIEVGHLSSTLCHLANIATRVGRTLQFDPHTEQILGDEEANRLVRRSYRLDHWAVPAGV
jgi:predicted dehydrogenase